MTKTPEQQQREQEAFSCLAYSAKTSMHLHEAPPSTIPRTQKTKWNADKRTREGRIWYRY